MDKPFWRCLRSYHVMCAQNPYECNICHKTIDPGDEYIGYVMVSREHMLVVEREHPDCFPDDPWDDDDRDEWEEDDFDFDLEDTPSDLPMAA